MEGFWDQSEGEKKNEEKEQKDLVWVGKIMTIRCNCEHGTYNTRCAATRHDLERQKQHRARDELGQQVPVHVLRVDCFHA